MTKALAFTQHALVAMAERQLERSWIERTVMAPQWRELDPSDPSIMRCFGPVPERGGRYLRVACVETPLEIPIVSAFLDRGARPK